MYITLKICLATWVEINSFFMKEGIGSKMNLINVGCMTLLCLC